jgi:hypothetical protein
MVQNLIPEVSDQKGIIADFKARGRKKMAWSPVDAII